jgi:hypothetical protein
MSPRHSPRLGLVLLRWFVADSALAGDLLEEYEGGRSRPWFYLQVFAAVWAEFRTTPAVIRPLQLVDLQPTEAIERSKRMTLRFPPVNLTATPVYGAGGLGLVMLSLLMTLVVPTVWLALAASMLAGVALGVVMILRHREHPLPRVG